MSTISNIQQQITINQRRLQLRKEQKAAFGLHTPPHISLEIEDTEETIAELEKSLAKLWEKGEKLDEAYAAEGKTQRVQIYLQGDFSTLTSIEIDRAIAVLAAAMEIRPQDIELYRAEPGSIVFDIGVPSDGVQRLRARLAANSAQLRLLKVERVILEQPSGGIEEWVFKEDKFELVGTASSSSGSDGSDRSGWPGFLTGIVIFLFVLALGLAAWLYWPVLFPASSTSTPIPHVLVSPTSTETPALSRTSTPSPTATPLNTPPPAVSPTTRPILTATPTNVPAPTATPTNTPPPQCSVVSEALNLRNGPGVVYVPPIAALPNGTVFTPLARNGDGSWLQVQIQGTAQQGWIASGSEYIICNSTVDIASLPVAPIPPTPTATPTDTPTPTATPIDTSTPTATPMDTPTPTITSGTPLPLPTTPPPPPATVSGIVWRDGDGDGVRDFGEAGLPNITVSITDSQRRFQIVTDANGGYTAIVASGRVTINVDENDPNLPQDSILTTDNNPTTVTIPAGGFHQEDFVFLVFG